MPADDELDDNEALDAIDEVERRDSLRPRSEVDGISWGLVVLVWMFIPSGTWFVDSV